MTGAPARVALVTGAAQGIGAAIAHRLAADGMGVAVTDVVAEGAERVAGDIAANGATAIGVRLDVTDAASVVAGVERVGDVLGPVDALVNNAGIVRISPFLRTDERDWDAVMDVNVKGVFLVTRAVAGGMVARGRGRIVNLASVVAHQVLGPYAAYHASKAAVIGLTQALAVELGGAGITVNAVAPGVVETPILDVLGGPDRRMPPSRVPLGRLGTPDDIADAVSWLVSDRARYVTGETLVVDGGLLRAGVRMGRPDS